MKRRSSAGKTGGNYVKQIVLFVLIDLCVLLLLKYKFNNLSLSDFSPAAFGNLLNAGFALLIIAGIFAVSRIKRITSFLNQKAAFILIIISFAVHLLILLHEYFHFGVPSFLNGIAATKRIYYSYLFILSQVIQLYVFSLVISAFFAEKKFIYIKAFFQMAFISVILILFSFFYSVLKKHDGENFKKGEYDTGVVLGAAVWQGNKPSHLFEGRIKKAYELYQNGIIKKIQLTGSNAPGEKSEAKTASDYLKKLGINPSDLYIEEKSSNTVEQIAFLKENSKTKVNYGKIIVISDEFHLVRALEICTFFDINAESSASEYNITSEKLLYYRLRESAALLLFWLFAV